MTFKRLWNLYPKKSQIKIFFWQGFPWFRHSRTSKSICPKHGRNPELKKIYVKTGKHSCHVAYGGPQKWRKKPKVLDMKRISNAKDLLSHQKKRKPRLMWVLLKLQAQKSSANIQHIFLLPSEPITEMSVILITVIYMKCLLFIPN